MATMSKAGSSNKSKNSGSDLKSIVVDGKTYNINDVKDGITKDFNNNGNLKAVEPILVNFDQLTTSTDAFNIKECISTSNFQLQTCYKCITNSLAMNNAKKANKVQKVQLSDVTYYIVPKVKPGAIKNVISYNRFMAICIAGIRVNLTKKIYDWNKHDYVAANTETLQVPDGVGNKLALSCGMDEGHDLYWFYASGFEYTFDLYPVEVICCVMLRLANAEEFKLNKVDDLDLVKNLASQIGKKGQIDDVLNSIGIDTISEAYAKYNSTRTDLVSVKRIKDTLSSLQDILKNMK
uniref:Nucleocapsid n=3 Tax=Emaravirus idaeobati TaxID=1980431 RepID=A0A6B7HL11_9VIRU|nr:nucleocapsid [Emaravirus idaeobati]